MLKITLYDLFEEIILKMSTKINKKALKEVLENSDADLNYTLLAYYNRIHNCNNRHLIEMIYVEDFETEEDFNFYIKEVYNMKIYKNDYSYRNGGKIKQKNTGLVLGYNNGYTTWGHWAFDVYKYIETIRINIDNIKDYEGEE